MAKGKNSLVVKSAGKMEEEWQTESDMRTLMEARKIKNDPKRMNAVREMAKCKLEGMASLIGQDGDQDVDD